MPADVISFARGAPSADILPAEAVREAAARALENDWKRALSYGDRDRPPGLCEWIAERHGARPRPSSDGHQRLARGRRDAVRAPARGRATGSSSSSPPTTAPCCCSAGSASTSSRSRSRRTASTSRRWSARSRAGPVKLVHVIPNFHNPAGCTLSARSASASSSSPPSTGSALFEDDPYRELPLRATSRCRRCSRRDEAGRVIHASSFSKTVSPGVRVGYLAGPDGRDQESRQARQRDTTSRRTCSPSRSSSSSAARARSTRTSSSSSGALRERRDDARRGASRADPRGRVRRARRRLLPLARPAGRRRHRASCAMPRARRASPSSPGPTSCSRAASSSLRLSFASVPPERIGEGVGRLARALGACARRVAGLRDLRRSITGCLPALQPALLRSPAMEPTITTDGARGPRSRDGAPDLDTVERRLADLAAAVREHERALSGHPYAVRHQDLHLYRRLRQICGGR